MGLYIGTDSVSSIYVGTDEVKKIYIGTDLVYSKEELEDDEDGK